MTQQFTASEVRELAATIWPDLSGREEVSEMLNVFADLLEAREKAVPVATVRWHSKHGFNWKEVGSGPHGDLHTGWIDVPLYTHPAPSDAERLVEALREQAAKWVGSMYFGMSGDDEQAVLKTCANDVNKILAAHYAQAQPPAASVPDGLVNALRHQRQIDEDGAEVGVSR